MGDVQTAALPGESDLIDIQFQIKPTSLTQYQQNTYSNQYIKASNGKQ
jgi:hypothetical protein